MKVLGAFTMNRSVCLLTYPSVWLFDHFAFTFFDVSLHLYVTVSLSVSLSVCWSFCWLETYFLLQQRMVRGE